MPLRNISPVTKENQMTNKLPHDHDYPVSVGAGLVANQTGTINPSDEATSTEWESMTLDQKGDWAHEFLISGQLQDRVKVFDYAGKYAISENDGLAINCLIADKYSATLDFEGVEIIISNFWSGLLSRELTACNWQFVNVNHLLFLDFLKIVGWSIAKENRGRAFRFCVDSGLSSGCIEIDQPTQ
jgi:hypothetical protein